MKKMLPPLLAISLAVMGCIFILGPDQVDQPAPETTSDMFLPDPATGLEGLSSYHQVATVSFNGTRAGKPVTFSDTYTRDFQQQPPAWFMVIESQDENGQPGLLILGSIGNAHYLQPASDQPCAVNWGELADPRAEETNPAGFLPAVEAASEAGQETVNDIPARHYLVNYGDKRWQVSGELWLAVTGGYLVKEELTIKASAGYLGPELEGEQSFSYALSQVNAAPRPMLVKGCPEVLMDIPAMSDAVDVVRLPFVLDYKSPSDVQTISAFYQEQMKELGWQLVGNHNKDPQNPVLIFLNDTGSRRAVISLEADKDGTWVNVQVIE